MSKSNKKNNTLEKCDELINRLNELKKAITTVGSTQVSSNRKPMNALGAGWSMDTGTGAFHHSTHGIISTTKHPDGYYQITHGGRSVGRAKDMNEAGAKIKNYVTSMKPNDTGMHNVDPMSIGKDEEGPKLSKSGKPFTPAQLEAIEEAKRIKKNSESGPWMRHGAVPSADEELKKMQTANPAQKAEDIMANQLANMMAGKAMLGQTPPRQPTDEEMFGHLVPSEEELEKADKKWNNTMNWLEEAVKPISSRFNSPEEEEAYWASIKVADRDDGKSSY